MGSTFSGDTQSQSITPVSETADSAVTNSKAQSHSAVRKGDEEKEELTREADEALRFEADERKREAEQKRQRRLEQKRVEQEDEKRVFAETVFEALDKDGSGYVDISELQEWIQNEPYFSQHMCQTSAESLLSTLDRDCDGRVCQEEFVRVFSRLKHVDQMTERLLLHQLRWDELPADDAAAAQARKLPAPTQPSPSRDIAAPAAAAVTPPGPRSSRVEFDEKPSQINGSNGSGNGAVSVAPSDKVKERHGSNGREERTHFAHH